MESIESKQKRMKVLLCELKRLFPNAKMVLNYSNPWELLVAVMLSAQCTDKMVNRVTAELFKKYPTLADYVSATQAEFEQDIRSTGYYRNKAKHVLATAKRVQEVYEGEVPKTMDDLLTLPGVARKTANVVLGNAFGIYEGMAVDTHVWRFARRFQFSNKKTSDGVEKDLLKIVPKDDWFSFTYLCIEYGRAYKSINDQTPKGDPLAKYLPTA